MNLIRTRLKRAQELAKEQGYDYKIGSSNVFADLGFEEAEELHLKARLIHLIHHIIEERGWTQQQAADVLGIKQPGVSALARGKRLEHYSVERLLHFLSRLEQRITITIDSAELPREVIVIEAEKLSRAIPH